ncbi:MAG: hypothetical protein LBQ88_07500 [Treponema sp.]|nr:hypothetical protein [Treponema sp.]
MEEQYNIPHTVISAPNGNQILPHKTHAGINGAYFLIEGYVNAVLRNNAEQQTAKRKFLESLYLK